MKKRFLIYIFISFLLLVVSQYTYAQCSICTKTAQQLGEGPAKDLNAGILYLAAAPLLIIGYVFYRWRKNNKEV